MSRKALDRDALAGRALAGRALPTQVRAAWFALASLALVLTASCQDLEGAPPQPEAALDPAFFRCRVQPILTKSCSMLSCHGDGARPFTIFARNRLRLGGTEAERNSFLGDDDRSWNFVAAAAMVDLRDPDASLLLMKPLAREAGGWFHGATEQEGGLDVFDDALDSEWMVLSAWVHGATDDASCVEPGSEL